MAFEKTQQSVEQREESGVESAEEQELKQEEETSDEDVQSSEQTQQAAPQEEQIDWKARAEKAEQERENYKQGLLNEKAGKRQLNQQVPKPVVEEPEETDTEVDRTDVSDDRIRSVIYKDNEKRALRAVVDSKSPLFLPELVDDSQYNEVIAYLPHAIDKSSVESIHRALRVAIKAWKYDKGIEDGPKESNSSVKASIAAVKSTNISQATPVAEKGGRRILKSSKGMQDWY
jgi:hypothetical protein